TLGQGLLVVPAAATLSAYATDTTAPVITVPAPISVTGTAAGRTVNYTVSAGDLDGTATVSCSPTDGATFQLGTTTVACTARDTAGNSSHASFTVTVTLDATAPTLTTPDHIATKANSPSRATDTTTDVAIVHGHSATLPCATCYVSSVA